MVAAEQPEPLRMSETEYLAFEDAQETRHEFSNGYVYAMTGGSLRHSVIIASTIAHMANQLDGKDCTVASSDLRLHIASKNAYRYPDVTVFCGEAITTKDRNDTITNPAILVEVLSPSTALVDYNSKLTEYTQIDSLNAYLIISQDEMKVDSYQRHESGKWLYESITGGDGEVNITALDCTLFLSKIYQRVNWDGET